MNNTYPDDVCFLLANDSIQEAETNKITLVGFYAGDNLIIKDEKPGKVLGQIVILAKFRGGAGKYKCKLKLIDPNQKSMIDDDNQIYTKEEGQNLLIGIKISPFPVDAFGDYKYTIELDDKIYSYNFKIGNDE